MADDENKESSERDDLASEMTGGFVSDTIRKVLTAGVSAAFMTEESIRNYVKEVKLPKDVLQLLLQGAAKSKEELTNTVTDEVVNIIKKIDFVEEASRFVEEHKFRISAEIEVVRKEEGHSGSPDSSFETKIKFSD